MFYVPKARRKNIKTTFVNFLKISFCCRAFFSFVSLKRGVVSKNVNHSVLIVASIKSLINMFENVKNISLVGEKRSSEVKMWHVRSK